MKTTCFELKLFFWGVVILLFKDYISDGLNNIIYYSGS